MTPSSPRLGTCCPVASIPRSKFTFCHMTCAIVETTGGSTPLTSQNAQQTDRLAGTVENTAILPRCAAPKGMYRISFTQRKLTATMLRLSTVSDESTHDTSSQQQGSSVVSIRHGSICEYSPICPMCEETRRASHWNVLPHVS